MSCPAALLICTLLIPSVLSADVTLTYKTEIKLNPALPATMAQTLNASRVLAPAADKKIVIKGGRSYAAIGPMNIIADIPNDKLTVLDSTDKHYATVPVSQYADQLAASMPKLPAAAQSMLGAIKLTTESRLTGRTAEIQGIQAAEREIVLSMGIPLGPNAPTSPVMKMVMQLWLAKQDEVARNPALREFVASGFQTLGGMNPAESIQKIMGQFPGMGDSLGAYLKEIAATHSPVLRVHAEAFMPILAMLAQRPAAGTDAAVADPNAPIMVMNEELTEISTAPVSDSVFRIPEGYTPVPLADIMSAIIPTLSTPAKSASPAVRPAIIRPDPITNGVAPPQ